MVIMENKMNTNNQKPVLQGNKITPKEMFWRLMEQWKAILLVIICFTALFLSAVHIRNEKVILAQNEARQSNQPTTTQQIIEQLQENEQSGVKTAYLVLQEKKRYGDYLQASPVMRIDPNHARRLRFTWMVVCENDNADEWSISYASKLQKEESIQSLVNSSETDLTVRQFNDLMFFKNMQETGSHVVCCDIFLTTEMNADKIQEVFKQQLETIHTQLERENGAHTIENYESDLSEVTDERLLSKQNTTLNLFMNLNNQLNVLVNGFSAAQKSAFEKIQNNDAKPAIDDTIISPQRTISVRNVMTGVILALVLYILVYFFYLLLTNRIMSTDVWRKSYVRTIGEWYSESSKKNHSSLTRDAVCWKRHHRHFLDMRKELNRAVDLISHLCKHNNLKEIAFVLTAKLSEDQSMFVHELVDGLEKEGVELIVIGMTKGEGLFIDDAILIQSEGVVISVLDSKTRYYDLETAFNQCNEFDKSILGIVYLG